MAFVLRWSTIVARRMSTASAALTIVVSSAIIIVLHDSVVFLHQYNTIIEPCLIHHSDSIFRLLHTFKKNGALTFRLLLIILAQLKLEDLPKFFESLFKLVLGHTKWHIPNKHLPSKSESR